MPKTTAVDLHAFVDAVDAERQARVCPTVRVYSRGMEPLDWHELPEHRPSGVASRSGAGLAPALSPASSAPAADRAASPRSRSPVRSGLGTSMASLEEWAGHFDGLVRPFRHGFVLGVEDALVDGLDQRRSIFVDAFVGNRGFCGEEILGHCLRRHLDGRRWEDVLELWEALRGVARAEFRECSRSRELI